MFTIYTAVLPLPCFFPCCFDPDAICSLLPLYYLESYAILYHTPHAFLPKHFSTHIFKKVLTISLLQGIPIPFMYPLQQQRL